MDLQPDLEMAQLRAAWRAAHVPICPITACAKFVVCKPMIVWLTVSSTCCMVYSSLWRDGGLDGEGL